ncbi:MAG TPA: hypothetical protein VFV50_15530, partial [Bdellovibrionales bacterium]|nr:hypothetical protein [Bdellovibrionales bacterium]
MKNWLLAVLSVFATLALNETIFYFANRSEWRNSIALSRDKGRVLGEAPGGERRFEVPESMSSLPAAAEPPVPYDSRLGLVKDAQKIAPGFYDLEYREKFGFMAATPGRTSRARMELVTGETVYDVTYTIDEFRRRVIPGESEKAAARHALFLGCSMTFGEGVAAQETFASAYGRLAKNERVYNSGSIGYGPADLLQRARMDPEYWNGIAEQQGFAVYTFIDDHVNRVFGAMSVTGVWGPRKPYFEDVSGELVYRGTFKSARPFRTELFSWLAKSQFVQFFRLDIPLYYTQGDFAFFAKV